MENKIEDLVSMYGEGAIKKTTSACGNTIVHYNDNSLKCFYKNTDYEIVDFNKSVTLEKFTTAIMENLDNMNGVIRGFNGDLNNLVTQFLNPINGNVLALMNILERKCVIDKKEIEEELKIIEKQRYEELEKLQKEKDIRSAFTNNKLELEIHLSDIEKHNKDEVEKAKKFIKSNDESYKEIEVYNKARETGKYINSKIKTMVEDGKTIRFIAKRHLAQSPDVEIAKKYIAFLVPIDVRNIDKIAKGDVYIVG